MRRLLEAIVFIPLILVCYVAEGIYEWILDWIDPVVEVQLPDLVEGDIKYTDRIVWKRLWTGAEYGRSYSTSGRLRPRKVPRK